VKHRFSRQLPTLYAPLLIAFAQQCFTAQIGNNGGPAFAFDGIERFQRIISCFSCT
jgi:hypothetical protein